MSTRSIYKKFCFVLILMGLILCGGRCAYAHISELTKAIDELKISPTIENLERLVCLFEEDVEYHQSRGEIVEAKRSKAMAVSVKVELAMREYNKLTEESYEKIITLLKLESDLWNDVKDIERTTDSLMFIKQCQIRLLSNRISIMLLKAQKNPTMENWKVISELSREESVLYNEIGDEKRAKHLLLQASEFKAVGAFYRARENSTIENWTETAKLYGETFKACIKDSDLIFARECIKRVSYADKMIVSLGGTPVGPPTNYEYVILTNDL